MPYYHPKQAASNDVPLGELVQPIECEMCAGDGFQMETVWVGGSEQSEHEVPCYDCRGRGQIVALVCGRCGHQESAHPDELVRGPRICADCGQEAPNFLWLPMGQREALEAAPTTMTHTASTLPTPSNDDHHHHPNHEEKTG